MLETGWVSNASNFRSKSHKHNKGLPQLAVYTSQKDNDIGSKFYPDPLNKWSLYNCIHQPNANTETLQNIYFVVGKNIFDTQTFIVVTCRCHSMFLYLASLNSQTLPVFSEQSIEDVQPNRAQPHSFPAQSLWVETADMVWPWTMQFLFN